MAERILLVDHEPNRCRLLQRRLARQGYEVASVGSLGGAVDELDGSQGVLLIDVGLLCGADRDRVHQLLHRLLESPVYACAECGRRLREMRPGAGAVTCCGRPMTRLEILASESGDEESRDAERFSRR